MEWTEQRIDMLRKLWGQGQTASQIATLLGGVTRNAVIGKAHHLGLHRPAVTDQARRHRSRGTSPEAGSPAPAAAEPGADAASPPHGHPCQPAGPEYVERGLI